MGEAYEEMEMMRPRTDADRLQEENKRLRDQLMQRIKELEAENTEMRKRMEAYCHHIGKLIWHLALLALGQRTHEDAEPGDLVIESTHLMGRRKTLEGDFEAFGTLEKIEQSKTTGTIYTIKDLNGHECRWSNAGFYVVMKNGGAK